MKKIISFILILSLLAVMSGCNGGNADISAQDTASSETTADSTSDTTDIYSTSGEETTGIPLPEPDFTEPADTTGSAETDVTPPEESTDTEALPETEAVTTLPEGEYEILVTDDEGVEWVVGSSNLFGSYGGATTTAPETTEPETTAPEPPETEPEEPEEPEPPETEPEEPEETEPPETEPEEPEEPEGPVTYPTVLMYHCVHDDPYTENVGLFVKPSELEKQLRLLQELEIDCLFASEFGPVRNNSVILTFDDGYEDNYTYMFPIIKKYNVKVTVFMIAYMIDKPGYLTSEQIKEMSDSGLVEFGSHTLDHPSLTTLDEDAIREQFAGSSWIIYQKTGKPVTSLAYPSGDYNERVMRIAREYYEFAYTTDATSYWGQDPMMLPRYAIYRDHTIHTFRNFVE